MGAVDRVSESDRLTWSNLTERIGRLTAETRAAQLERALYEIQLRETYKLVPDDKLDIGAGVVIRARKPKPDLVTKD